MNTEKETKITSDKIIEDQERLKQKYETEIKAAQQENLSLQNTILKKDDEIFELQKANEGLGKDRDDWKREASARRKAQAESKQVKEAQDFETEFIKLQAKKGWSWDESQGWVKAN